MRNIIIGTSGHIDHGKTSILKELTGIDADRLKEEKERGISIDIGFSYVDFNDRKVGIIDMPGHEKFIKNMLAGAHGIDIALLVIAADDGIMPQTKEHFDILRLLGIKHGIICLNKIDLVDKELIDIRVKQIKDYFKGSFLENATIVETSIKQQATIDELKSVLQSKIDLVELQDEEKPIFRMAIDRSFSLKGIGTVLTGTTQGKDVNLSDELEIYPISKYVTVKNIQNHNMDVSSLSSGNRCALNISGISKDEIKRGFVIGTKNSLHTSDYIDVKIEVLKNAKKAIKNNQRLRIYHQTKEVMARIKVLEGNEIKPGGSAYAQLVLEKPLIALNGDKGIIRLYSPLITIAGFEVVNTQAEKVKDDKLEYVNKLRNYQVDYIKVIEEVVRKCSNDYLNIDQIKKLTSINKDINTEIESLLNSGLIRDFTKGKHQIYLHRDYLKLKESEVRNYLNEYHRINPLQVGCLTNEINKRFFPNIKSKLFLDIIKTFKTVSSKKQYIYNNDFKIKLSEEQRKVKNMIISNFKQNSYKPEKVQDIKNSIRNKRDFDLVFEMLINQGILIFIDKDMFLLDSLYNNLMEYIYEVYENKSKITLQDIKTYTDSSRKFIVSYLEHFDKKNITRRVDDYRVIIKKRG